jgi:hypothetical protein
MGINNQKLVFNDKEYKPDELFYVARNLVSLKHKDGEIIEYSRETATGKSESEAIDRLKLSLYRDIVLSSRIIVYCYKLLNTNSVF